MARRLHDLTEDSEGLRALHQSMGAGQPDPSPTVSEVEGAEFFGTLGQTAKKLSPGCRENPTASNLDELDTAP